MELLIKAHSSASLPFGWVMESYGLENILGIRLPKVHRVCYNKLVYRIQVKGKAGIMLRKLNLKAYGKINLGLDVIGKREDGYHEVRMIMQTVSLYDTLELVILERPGIRLETNLTYLPVNEDNLAYKAAKLLLQEFKLRRGIMINLKKHIPVAAGMAGGSSDAAAVLYGINRLFSLGLTTQQLMERGVKLGADVPYCVLRGTALSEGIGEKLHELKPIPDCWILIAKPAISVSTRLVYEKLRVDELSHHPDIDGMLTAIENQELEGIANRMENVLETVTIPTYPIIQDIKNFMKEHGAMNALMSGSGPTVFGLYDKEESCRAAAAAIKKAGLAKLVYTTVPAPRRL